MSRHGRSQSSPIVSVINGTRVYPARTCQKGCREWGPSSNAAWRKHLWSFKNVLLRIQCHLAPPAQFAFASKRTNGDWETFHKPMGDVSRTWWAMLFPQHRFVQTTIYSADLFKHLSRGERKSGNRHGELLDEEMQMTGSSALCERALLQHVVKVNNAFYLLAWVNQPDCANTVSMLVIASVSAQCKYLKTMPTSLLVSCRCWNLANHTMVVKPLHGCVIWKNLIIIVAACGCSRSIWENGRTSHLTYTLFQKHPLLMI